MTAQLAIESPPAGAPRLRRPRYLPALDGLRGFAVAAVVAYHLGWLPGGFLGVDLFFVLSGFLITRIITAEIASTNSLNLRRFWARRFRRLAPSLFIVLGSVGAYVAIAGPNERPVGIGRQFAAAFTWTSNWEQLLGSGYWTSYGAPSPLRHLWSLAIEEQFYLVFPVIVIMLYRWARNPRAVAFLLAVAATVTSAWALFLVATDAPTDRVYLGTDTRIGALLIGAAAALWIARGLPRFAQSRWMGAIVVVSSIVSVVLWATLSFDRINLAKWALLLVSGICSLMLVLACARRNTNDWFHRLMTLRPLRRLGMISYALYLVHWPIHIWLGSSAPETSPTVRGLIVVALSVPIAAVLTSLVEQPIRLRSFTSIKSFAPLAATAAVVIGAAGVGAVMTSSSTPTQRLLVAAPSDTMSTPMGNDVDSDLNSAASATTDAQPTDPNAAVAGATSVADPATPLDESEAPAPDSTPAGGQAIAAPASNPSTTPTPTPRLLMLGDSVAAGIQRDFLASAKTAGIPALSHSMIGCGIAGFGDGLRLANKTPVAPTRNCTEWRNAWRSTIERFAPTDVIVIRSTVYFEEVNVGGAWHPVCSSSYHDFYRDHVIAEIDEIASQGARVALANIAYNRSKMLVMSGEDAVRRNDANIDCLNAALRDAIAARPDSARLLDLAAWVCPNGQCPTGDEATRMRPDGVHFENGGAVLMANWVVEATRRSIPAG